MLALDLVYQYRKLLGKCEAGLGLDVEEIIAMTALEASFTPIGRGKFAGESVDTWARLRGAPGLNDAVRVTELGPNGLTCRQTPFVEEGAIVEIVIDDARDDLSYRFWARVTALREDIGDDFALTLELVGQPLLVHYGPLDHVEDAVDRIAREASQPEIKIAA
jgi:hypothetical protein